MNRKEMMNEIAQYKMENGYYDTIRMRVEIAGMSEADARYDEFWGSTDVGQRLIDRYPLIKFADELNDRRDAGKAEAEQAEGAADVAAALERVESGTASNSDRNLLVTAGLARQVYGDPDSNRPTHIELLSQPQRSDADADVEY